MGIYRVRVYGKTRAELEVAEDGTIICTGAGGAASHFEVPLRNLIFAEQVSHDTVLLNFFHNGDADSPVQVSLTSGSCASMFGEITSAVSSPSSSQSLAEPKDPAALGDD